MAFTDLISRIAKEAQMRNLGEVALTAAMGVPVAMIAESLSPKISRPRVRADVSRLFGGLALGALDRPRQEKEMLANLLTQQGLIRFAPPKPGAAPLLNLAGMPLYTESRLAREVPGLLPAGKEQLAPEPTPSRIPLAPPPAGIAMPPVESLQRQRVLSPEEQVLTEMYGGQLASDPVMRALEAYRLKAAQAQTEMARQREAREALLSQAGTEGGTLDFRIDAKGNLVPTLRGPRPLGPREKAFEQLTPEEKKQVLLRPPRPTKFTMSDYKQGLMQSWQATGRIPPGFTQDQFERFVGMRGGISEDIERAIAKDVQRQLERKVAPYRGLIKKHGALRIPPEEFSMVMGEFVDPRELQTTLDSIDFYRGILEESKTEAPTFRLPGTSLIPGEGEFLRPSTVPSPIIPPISGPRYRIKTGKLAGSVIDNLETLRKLVEQGTLSTNDEYETVD